MTQDKPEDKVEVKAHRRATVYRVLERLEKPGGGYWEAGDVTHFAPETARVLLALGRIAVAEEAQL